MRRVELPPGRKFEPDRGRRRREIGKKVVWGAVGGGRRRWWPEGKSFFGRAGWVQDAMSMCRGCWASAHRIHPKKSHSSTHMTEKRFGHQKKFTILYGKARSGKFPIVNFQAVQRAPILNFFWDRNCVGRLYMGEDLFWGPGGQIPKGCWRSSGPAVKVTCYFGATWRLLASGRAMSGPRTCLRPPLDNLEYQSSGQRG